MLAAWIGSEIMIAGAVALEGGPRVSALSWLAIPVITLSTRFSMRGVVAGGVPILPVWGCFDRITPQTAASEFAAVARAPVQWVPGGHSWMLARPQGQADILTHLVAGKEFMENFPIPPGREDELARKVLMTHLQSGNSYGIQLKRQHCKFAQPLLGPWVTGSEEVGTDWRPAVMEGWEPSGH